MATTAPPTRAVLPSQRTYGVWCSRNVQPEIVSPFSENGERSRLKTPAWLLKAVNAIQMNGIIRTNANGTTTPYANARSRQAILISLRHLYAACEHEHPDRDEREH